jgi:hypothetical protein
MNETELTPGGASTETLEQCEMAIFYDDDFARDRAMHLCDRLTDQFHQDPAFDFSWWRIRHLKDPAVAQLASQAAARADLLFVSSSRGEPPVELKEWMKKWLPSRKGHEGALVTWVNRSSSSKKKQTQLEVYLRDVAKKGQLDFLPLIDAAAA